MTHITYTQAQRLKSLGFDKPVCAYYSISAGLHKSYNASDFNKDDRNTSAPTPYEVLDWFREVKGIDAWVHLYYDISAGKRYKYTISNSPYSFDKYRTHPEALSGLIDKLIEILEEQKA